MLVSAAKMLKDAKAGKYAVGHFNINNLEWTKAILLTAQELNSPLSSACPKARANICAVSRPSPPWLTLWSTSLESPFWCASP